MHQTFDVIIREPRVAERVIYRTGWDSTGATPSDTQRAAHDRALEVACAYAAKHHTVNPIVKLVTHGSNS